MTDLYPDWKQAAYEISERFTYGDMVYHDWILNALKLEPPEYATPTEHKRYQLRLLNDIEAIKEELLLDHQMYLSNVRGEGYLVVKPEEQTTMVMKQFKKTIRKAFRAGSLGLTNLNRALLNDTQRKHNNDQMAILAHLKVMTRRGIHGKLLPPDSKNEVPE